MKGKDSEVFYLRLTKEQLEWLKQKAEKEGRTMAGQVRHLLQRTMGKGK